MGLVVVAVVCTATSQIVQALAARRLVNKPGVVAMLCEPLVLLAYVLLGVGLLFWLVALTELEVSRTYPLFALGFVATMLFARFGLGEEVTLRGWIGSALIVLGGALCNL